MQQVLINWNLLKKFDIACWKSKIDKLGNDKLEKVPIGLKSFRSKVDKSDVIN